MSFWWWVLLYGAIAVGALVLYGLLGLGLWRRVRQLSADLGRLNQVVASAQREMGTVQADDWAAAVARRSRD